MIGLCIFLQTLFPVVFIYLFVRKCAVEFSSFGDSFERADGLTNSQQCVRGRLLSTRTRTARALIIYIKNIFNHCILLYIGVRHDRNLCFL